MRFGRIGTKFPETPAPPRLSTVELRVRLIVSAQRFTELVIILARLELFEIEARTDDVG